MPEPTQIGVAELLRNYQTRAVLLASALFPHKDDCPGKRDINQCRCGKLIALAALQDEPLTEPEENAQTNNLRNLLEKLGLWDRKP